MVMEMSKTYQYRKVMKPLLERKRRARINKCLDDLKDLMVECLQREGEHVTRLEKADILELTVEHMRKLKQSGGLMLHSKQTAHAHVESFRSGYVHAADQITQVLFQQQQTDKVGDKILRFLSTRLIELQQQLFRSSTPSTSTTDEILPHTPNSLVEHAASHLPVMPISPMAFLSTQSTSKDISSSLATPTTCNTSTKETDQIDITSLDPDSSDTSSNADSVWRPW